MRGGGTTLGLLMLAACPEDTEELVIPDPAPLATLSDGECPNMSVSGDVTSFSSDGRDRNVAFVFPDQVTEGMPMMFVFHGLVNFPPIPSTISGFGLQQAADDLGVIFVVPESPIMDMGLPGLDNIYLWGILGEEDPDLVLYDDLRACAAEEFGADLTRVSAYGFSGGALWTSMLLIKRADTLAAVAQSSGGSDIDALTFGKQLHYKTPAAKTPALLSTGGTYDAWPDPTLLTIVDFSEATDNLQEGLLADGHTVLRCNHKEGHWVPDWYLDAALEWNLGHTFGVASPWATDPDALHKKCKIPE